MDFCQKIDRVITAPHCSIITIVSRSSTGSSSSSSSSSSSVIVLLLLLLSSLLSLFIYFHCYTCHYYYSRVPLCRGSVQHNITYNTLSTDAEHKSEFVFTAPHGRAMECFYWEEFGEN